MKRISSVAGVVVILATLGSSQDVKPANPTLLRSFFGKLPITFIENRGVYPEEVKYYVQGSDKTLFFTKRGITFRLNGEDRSWVVKLEFLGVNQDVVLRGEDKQQAVFSYFKGPAKDWKTRLRTYAKVVYEDLWPGIDLVYRGTVNRLKYEFIVNPGADPGKIRLRYRGVTSLALGKDGALRIETPEGSFGDAPPLAWQEISDRRVPVEMRYRLGNGEEFGFDIGGYDRTMPLILDPAIFVTCGYIGGAGDDRCDAIAVDPAGNAYVTGYTGSDQLTFPVTVGPDLTYNGGRYSGDVFVAKVNAQGTGLVYCGYIGGADDDSGKGIALDPAGNAYVTGYAYSDQQTFPVTVGPDLTFNGNAGCCDAFVAKVNAQGTGLVYCGYIGGAARDYGKGIALDPAGNAYMTGETRSDQKTFPVKTGPDLTYNGNAGCWDAFVAKVNAQGTGLVYCGYIGGASIDHGNGIALDPGGNAYVTGKTGSDSKTFPVTVGPDLTFHGVTDAFVAKVNAQGTGLVYCGYIGGEISDKGYGIAVDPAGNAYVTGHTDSDQKTFPVTVGPDLTYNDNGLYYDAFVAKVNAQGTGLVYCGYIGGADYDCGSSIAVDRAGNAYVAGSTDSDQQTFPVRSGPDLTYNGGWDEAFVAKVNAQGTGLVYCGYIGGVGDDTALTIAIDPGGNAYVAGGTSSDQQTFPVQVGPDLTHNGSGEGFVAKIALLDDLTAYGATHPGGTITLDLAAVEVRGLPYQVGTSLGTGPIPIDTRKIALGPDDLLFVSGSDLWPAVFKDYRGMIDGQGKAKASIGIPDIPALIGVRLHTAFVTLDPTAPSGIRSISNTFSFTVSK